MTTVCQQAQVGDSVAPQVHRGGGRGPVGPRPCEAPGGPAPWGLVAMAVAWEGGMAWPPPPERQEKLSQS